MKSLLLCRKVRSENVVAEESATEGKKGVIYDNKGRAERWQRRRNCPQKFNVARAVLTAHKHLNLNIKTAIRQKICYLISTIKVSRFNLMPHAS
jgi:hypothetical protein